MPAATEDVAAVHPDLSAARTRRGVKGYWRILTPVASKNAFPIAATTAGSTSSPAPLTLLVDLLDDDRSHRRVVAESECLIAIPVEARDVRLVELHLFSQRQAGPVHRHADDLTLDDPRIDGQPAIHRAVDVFRHDDAVVLVHLDVHDSRRIRDAIPLVLRQVVRAESNAAPADDSRPRQVGRRNARRPLRRIGRRLEDAEPARMRDVPFAELVRIQPGRVRELVHHPFLREEHRRIHRRAQRTGSQIPAAGDAVVDDPPVRDVVHVGLRQVHRKEPPLPGPAPPPTLPGGGVPSANCDAVSSPPAGMTPGLVLEGDELAVGVDSRAQIGQKRGPIVVPTEFVFAAELQTDRLADFLRHDGCRLCHVAVATAAVRVRAGVVLHANLLDRQAEQTRDAVARLVDALVGAHDEGTVLGDVRHRAVRRHRPVRLIGSAIRGRERVDAAG